MLIVPVRLRTGKKVTANARTDSPPVRAFFYWG